jgi:hypothetical protein
MITPDTIDFKTGNIVNGKGRHFLMLTVNMSGRYNS